MLNKIDRPPLFQIKHNEEVTAGYPGELARWISNVVLYFAQTAPDSFKNYENVELPLNVAEYLQSNPTLILYIFHKVNELTEINFRISTKDHILNLHVGEEIFAAGEKPGTKTPIRLTTNTLSGFAEPTPRIDEAPLLKIYDYLGLASGFLERSEDERTQWLYTIVSYLNHLLTEDAANDNR